MRALSADEMAWVSGGQSAPPSGGGSGSSQPSPSGPTGNPSTDRFLADNPDHPLNDPAYRKHVERLNDAHEAMVDDLIERLPGAIAAGAAVGGLPGALMGAYAGVVEVVTNHAVSGARGGSGGSGGSGN